MPLPSLNASSPLDASSNPKGERGPPKAALKRVSSKKKIVYTLNRILLLSLGCASYRQQAVARQKMSFLTGNNQHHDHFKMTTYFNNEWAHGFILLIFLSTIVFDIFMMML